MTLTGTVVHHLYHGVRSAHEVNCKKQRHESLLKNNYERLFLLMRFETLPFRHCVPAGDVIAPVAVITSFRTRRSPHVRARKNLAELQP